MPTYLPTYLCTFYLYHLPMKCNEKTRQIGSWILDTIAFQNSSANYLISSKSKQVTTDFDQTRFIEKCIWCLISRFFCDMLTLGPQGLLGLQILYSLKKHIVKKLIFLSFWLTSIYKNFIKNIPIIRFIKQTIVVKTLFAKLINIFHGNF